MSTPNLCPTCRQANRKVGRGTVQAMLKDPATLPEGEGLRFCPNPDCPTVYSHPDSGEVWGTAELKVEVFQKSRRPERLVCYCFDHTVAAVRDEVVATGESAITASIKAACKEGLDRCAETNPQGTCCLGNVGAVVRAARAGAAVEEPVPACDIEQSAGEGSDCCAPRIEVSDAPDRAGRRGLWAAGGAILAAVLSSACCWLPLLAVALGMSAAGVAGFFEAYRPIFLGVTALLLGAGFYLLYIRKPTCKPGDACAVPNPRLRKMSRMMLWVSTVMVLAFATFPAYVGTFFDDGSASEATAAETAKAPLWAYDIEGMTCQGCSRRLQGVLAKMPGVRRAKVDFEKKEAKVWIDPKSPPKEAAILKAIEEAGFKGKRTS